ncbi:MAG TPA: dipeptidase [Bryobacteraceae bacterium]|jgi:membrane dipeptidase|nr:dipeptidase [Bryobacteraceae bacterium]
MRLLLPVLLATLTLQAQDDMARARRISAEAIGIDSHIDTIQHVLVDHVDLANRLPNGMVDFPRLREGGMKAPFFALWVPVYYKGAEAVRRTLDLRDAMQSVLDAHQDQIELATGAGDIERIVKSKKIAAFLAIEGGHQIDDDLAVLRMYYRMGIRAMTLTHFKNNNWADSSTDKPAHNGLTPFGKEVVREMNRLGMLVDVSHVSDKTFYDALEVSTKPVIVSHSSSRAISNIPRNVTDDMLRALAKNGGVVGINFGEGFISQKDVAALQSAISSNQSAPPDMTGKILDDYANEEFRKDLAAMKTGLATLSDVADHVDHMVKVAGIDHVGIGSDFDGITSPPEGLADISKMPSLVAVLLKRGYSEQDIKKILGGNYLRVIREVTGR